MHNRLLAPGQVHAWLGAAMMPSPPEIGQYSVLIVEHDASLVSEFAQYLRVATEFEVAVVNRTGAIRAAIGARPNAIFVDLDGATQDGIEIASTIRRDATVKPLLFAVSFHPLNAEHLFAAGFDRCLAKPICFLEAQTALRLHELELAVGAR